MLYADDHRVEEAIKAFQAAEQLDPNNAATLNNLGFLLMSSTRNEEAHIAFQKAVGLDSSRPKYWTNMGYNLAAMGRFDDALSAFQGVGSNADAHANLGFAYELNGALNDAILSYQTALNLDSNHIHAKNGVARIINATPE